jgi:methyl-accepting chemotaxis protein
VEHILGLITQLQVLNSDVKKAASDEQKYADSIVKGVGGIRNIVSKTLQSTEEQSSSLLIISKNIESTSDMAASIAVSSEQQLVINSGVGQAMYGIAANSKAMIEAIQEIASSINGVSADVETLRKEMAFFRIEKDN